MTSNGTTFVIAEFRKVDIELAVSLMTLLNSNC